MFSKFFKKLDGMERKWRYSFGYDISTPEARRKSKWTHKRFLKYRDMGIKSVINLRGEDKYAHYLFEEESCRILGIKLYNTKLWARTAANRENIVAVIDAMRMVQRPFLFHCKSGADRAGFCAAMYQIIFDDVPVQEARKQLSIKFIHLKWSKTGVQGYILDVFEARQAKGNIDFETWIRTEYDNTAIQNGFDSKTPAAQIA